MAMVGTKVGTKNWGTAPQNEITKKEGVNNISAHEMQKLNGEDIGNVANRLADPNYIPPEKKMRTVGNDKLDKDAFMKLMLAQMKNQDPTNPLKSHEMAAQLAQFTSLEQLQNMNTSLTEIKNGQKPTESFQALNFIGKAVSGDSAKLVRSKGDTEHDFNFVLPDDAKSVQIKVRNQQGEIVRSVDLKDMKKGQNKWVWNGQNDNGMSAMTGEYQFVIEAKNAADKKLAVKTDFDGIISGVSYTNEGPVLVVGNQSVKLKDVKKIVDPSLMKNDQNSGSVKKPDLKNGQVAAKNEDKQVSGGAQEASFTPNNLESVGMSQGMINTLAKETKPESKPQAKSEASKPEQPSQAVAR